MSTNGDQEIELTSFWEVLPVVTQTQILLHAMEPVTEKRDTLVHPCRFLERVKWGWDSKYFWPQSTFFPAFPLLHPPPPAQVVSASNDTVCNKQMQHRRLLRQEVNGQNPPPCESAFIYLTLGFITHLSSTKRDPKTIYNLLKYSFIKSLFILK